MNAPSASREVFHHRELLHLDDVQEQSRSRLVEQLRYVAGSSRFYGSKWDEEAKAAIAHGTPDGIAMVLEELPLTTKDELRFSQESDPPFGTLLACPSDEVRRVHRTSGTTGRPLLIPATSRDIAVTTSHGAQAFWCAGLRPSDVVVHCLNYCMWAGGVTDHMCLEGTGAAVVPFGVGNTATLVALQQWLPFTALSCTPTYVSTLLEQLRGDDRERWARHVRLLLVGGEPGGSQPELREAAAEALGARVVNANYGLAEVMSNFGSECPIAGGLHFHGQEAVWPEVLDPSTGRPLPLEAGTYGELVLTHLQQRAQPLVRYQTNDLVEIHATEPCDCGRTSFRFRLHGRADDMFVVRGVNIFPGAIGEALIEISPDLRHFVITLPRADMFDFIPLQVEGSLDHDADKLVAAIAERVKARIGCSAQVTILPPGTLPRGESKTRRVYRDGETPW